MARMAFACMAKDPRTGSGGQKGQKVTKVRKASGEPNLPEGMIGPRLGFSEEARKAKFGTSTDLKNVLSTGLGFRSEKGNRSPG